MNRPGRTVRHQTKNKGDTVFLVYCLWSAVLLCRPQDFIPVLSAFRPLLLTTALMLAVLVTSGYRSQQVPYLQDSQVKLYVWLYAVMILSIPMSLYARLSFNTVLMEYIIVVIYFFISFRLLDSLEKLQRLLLIGCVGIGLYSIAALMKGTMVEGRLFFGDVFDPNDLAYLVLAFMPFNLLFIGRENKLILRMVCLGLSGVGVLFVLLTGSRGGLLALGMALVVLMFNTSVLKSSFKVAIIAFCIVALPFAPINMERFSTMFSIKEDYNVQGEEGRIAIWKIGLRAMFENPLTGVGVRNFGYAVGLDRERRGLASARWQAPHNSAIQIGTETGIIGFTLFLLLSWKVVKIIYQVKLRSKNIELVRIAETGLVGFVGMFVASMFLSQAYSVYWAFYIVFSAVVQQLYRREIADTALKGSNG